MQSCRPLHVLFPLFCPAAAAPLQPLCVQCVCQCGLFTVLLCRLTGATLSQLDCNAGFEHRPELLAQKEAFTSVEKLSARRDPEGQLVRNSCYTALCINVDYSGCCCADRMEPQKTCW